MKSRKQALKTMSSLIGNAAGHMALYPRSEFAIKEVLLYEDQAEALAQARHWNEQEIEILREKSKRHAANAIHSREYDDDGRKFEDLLAVAENGSDRFIKEELRW